MDCFNTSRKEDSILIELLSKAEYKKYIDTSLETKATWLLSSNRSVKEGSHYLIPNAKGKLDQVLVIANTENSVWSIANLPWALPPGDYHLSDSIAAEVRQRLSIGWGLGAYRYNEYQNKDDKCARLYCANDIKIEKLNAIVHSTRLVRDLVNTPANEMMPTHLAAAAQSLAEKYEAEDASFYPN